MSRVGKKPIDLPDSVDILIKNSSVTVKGPKGSLTREFHSSVAIETKDGQLVVSRPNNSKLYRSLHGLYRSLLNNMVLGVTHGFEKKLEIVGVGYKGELKNNRLVLQLGYSHPIVFIPPEEITISVDNPTHISIRGIDKELVGRVAAKIRSFRPPEPYKGKGVKYEDEYIRRKAGKTAA
ncbi:MAG: 50S ribosomal protein L6 [bacterium]